MKATCYSPKREYYITHKMPYSIIVPSTQSPSHLIVFHLSCIEHHVLWLDFSNNFSVQSFNPWEHLTPTSILGYLILVKKGLPYPIGHNQRIPWAKRNVSIIPKATFEGVMFGMKERHLLISKAFFFSCFSSKDICMDPSTYMQTIWA